MDTVAYCWVRKGGLNGVNQYFMFTCYTKCFRANQFSYEMKKKKIIINNQCACSGYFVNRFTATAVAS